MKPIVCPECGAGYKQITAHADITISVKLGDEYGAPILAEEGYSGLADTSDNILRKFRLARRSVEYECEQCGHLFWNREVSS